jgi:hypothetical protein
MRSAANSWARRLVRRSYRRPIDTFETDEGHLQVTGRAQEVHDARQLSVGNRLVGAEKNALVAVGRGRGIECRGQLPRRYGTTRTPSDPGRQASMQEQAPKFMVFVPQLTQYSEPESVMNERSINGIAQSWIL